MDMSEDEKYIYNMYVWHEERRISTMRLHRIPSNLQKNYYFLTINPPPNIELNVFLKAVHKSCSKKWLKHGVYVIEQRGETQEDAGRGFHAHILFNKGNKHSIILREMKSSFKSIVDTENNHFFNIKNIDNEEYKRKEEYILFQKADPEKHQKQEIDIIFRENNNLKSHYIIGYLPENG